MNTPTPSPEPEITDAAIDAAIDAAADAGAALDDAMRTPLTDEEKAQLMQAQAEAQHLQMANGLLSPMLAHVMSSMIETMGIHAVVAIGGTLGSILCQYSDALAETTLMGAPPEIQTWMDGVRAITSKAMEVKNASKPAIIQPPTIIPW